MPSAPAGAAWSDDAVSCLRSLWDDGHSTSDIGRRLGVSKNAVIGKARRLKLSRRPSPIRSAGSGCQRRPRRGSVPKLAGICATAGITLTSASSSADGANRGDMPISAAENNPVLLALGRTRHA
jgi:GcrA cell cycle regulator